MSAMPISTASSPSRLNSRRLHKIFNLLLKHFGPRHWWPADAPWEMMVGAILVQNTAWTNVQKAIASLKAANALTLPQIAVMPRRHLEKLIRSSGFFRQKAKRLQNYARYLLKHPQFHRQLLGQASPPPPLPVGEGRRRRRRGEAVVHELRQRLLALDGIGPETADSILLYAGKYPIFVVDAYTRRMGQRIGLFKLERYSEIQAYFESALPRKVPLYNEFHALIVMLCKTYCKKSDPRCEECPLKTECQFGQKILRAQTRKAA